MRAVEFNQYGTTAVLEVVSDAQPPRFGSNEVLIQVFAASVNPVDCEIRKGHGKDVLRFKGQVGRNIFPQRIGQDAAGVIIAVGGNVRNFKIGDKVYCAPTRACMADIIAVDEPEVALMPSNLSFLEAASLPYVALTAWSTLVNQVGLTSSSAYGKSVLITRSAGGVGSFAVQLLKAWGAHVISACSARNMVFVKSLGADRVVDYTVDSIRDVVVDIDVALDGSAGAERDVQDTLRMDAGASYITLISPKLRLIDEFGVEEGSRRALALFAEKALEQEKYGRHYYWGFVRSDGLALAEITKLVEAGSIRPVIDRVFPLAQIAAAHEYCETGQVQGKIVIDFQNVPVA